MKPPNRIAVALFDLVLGFLLRPRLRRVRRWSFLVTTPALIVAGRASELDLGDGIAVALVVGLLDALVLAGVVLGGARLLGPERRDALLDLLMHPVIRRAIVGEARMLATFPLVLARRLRRPRGETFAYHRGTHALGMALALLPAMFAEAAVVHLLMPREWVWVQLGLGALHAYGVLMLLSWAIGERTCPHRLRDGMLELRAGQLYRLRIAAREIAAIELAPRHEGQRTGLLLTDGTPRLAAGGRTDVRLRFTVPVTVERPLGDPVAVSDIEIAVDDPRRFVAAVAAATTARRPPVEAPARAGWATVAALVDALA